MAPRRLPRRTRSLILALPGLKGIGWSPWTTAVRPGRFPLSACGAVHDRLEPGVTLARGVLAEQPAAYPEVGDQRDAAVPPLGLPGGLLGERARGEQVREPRHQRPGTG